MHLQTKSIVLQYLALKTRPPIFWTAARNFTQSSSILKGISCCFGYSPGTSSRKASAAQAVAAFFTRLFYHALPALSSTFYAFFGKNMTFRPTGRTSCPFTPSVIACGDATFPKGTAFVPAGRFKAPPKGVPLGKLAASETSRLKGYSPYASISLPSAKE